MKHDRDKIVDDFVRWYERNVVEPPPTVRVPRAPNVPPDVRELARYLEAELAIKDVDDTGVHRIEVLHRACASAKPHAPTSDDRRLDSLWEWRRKGVVLLFVVIGLLLSAVAALSLKLLEAHAPPTHQMHQPKDPSP